MAGERESVEDLGPGRRPSFEDEAWQWQQLACEGFGLGGIHRPTGARADGDQIVVRTGHCTGFEIEAEAELGQKQQLITDQGDAPAAGRGCCLDRCEQGPVIVVYPEEVWYTYVDQKDIDEIIDEHLVNGRVVERLRI